MLIFKLLLGGNKINRKNFNEIKDIHIIACEEIIKNEGICIKIICECCPFDKNNNPDLNSCSIKYTSNKGCGFEDSKSVESAKEFLNMLSENVDILEFDELENGLGLKLCVNVGGDDEVRINVMGADRNVRIIELDRDDEERIKETKEFLKLMGFNFYKI